MIDLLPTGDTVGIQEAAEFFRLSFLKIFGLEESPYRIGTQAALPTIQPRIAKACLNCTAVNNV